MNSKCRKSNLVAHWYILLFAYLPAPVVSSCVSGLGTSNTQRYAYIFLLFFYNCVSFSPHLAFLCLLLTPVHRFPSSICLSPPLPLPLPLHPATSLILFPLSPSDIRVYFPPGRMHDRGAGGTESKWQISLLIPPCISLSLSLSLSPSHPLSCQRPSSAFLPPSFLRAPSHRIWPHWYSNLPRLHSTFSRREGLVKTTKGERRWANVPTLILKTQLDTSEWQSVRPEWCSAALQIHAEINWSWLSKDCKTA